MILSRTSDNHGHGIYQVDQDVVFNHGETPQCKHENKASLGCVEGLNNTIRVIQCNAYGFRDEEYLAMKIITHFLPVLPDHAKITHTIPRWADFLFMTCFYRSGRCRSALGTVI